jgi:MurNAc alpha-1-phosphate uridylyltransferase
VNAKIKKAMVLAAGYGKRLLPLTERIPKPLIPVAGRPMIDYALEKLKAYGIQEVVINVSYLGQQLTAYLKQFKGLKFTISEEPEPLETGGGLRNARRLLGNDPLFTINSDILWFDAGESALDRLTRCWDSAHMDVLLLACSKAKAVGHETGEDQLFIKPGNTSGWQAQDAPYIFAGITILNPRLVDEAPEGKFSVKVLWNRALTANRLACLPHQGRWFQTGTLADIKRTEEILATDGKSYVVKSSRASRPPPLPSDGRGMG